MMNSFILASALTFGQPNGQVLPSQDAPRYIGKALYKELKLDKTLDRIEKKYLQLEKYPELGYVGIGLKIVIEKRFTKEWRF